MKKHILYIIACIGIVATILSCKSNSSTHNSQNSLDWVGVYKGTLPCASCNGIETVIKLNNDNTYQSWTKYLDKDDEIFSDSGDLTWSKDGNVITLNSSSNQEIVKYKVQENKILHLDQSGKIIKGDLANHYILNKESFDNDIKEKYWRIVEVMGQPVEKNFRREPHIILKNNGNIIGNGGCNSLQGSYKLDENNRISFSKIISTQMACPSLETEQKLLKAIQTADSYILNGDELTLIKGRMAPLAKLKVVYLY